MGKNYKGFYVPPAVDSLVVRKRVRRGLDILSFGCFLQDLSPGRDCAGVDCSRCIACANHGDVNRKREVFAHYDREFPVEEKVGMPELKPGMIVQTSKGFYYLVVAGRKDDVVAYSCYLDLNDLRITDAVSFRTGDPAIDAVYDEAGAHWFRPAVIVDILRGSERHRIWKKPDPVKEMTVDEISKVLGYKVKVVGSEKADD